MIGDDASTPKRVDIGDNSSLDTTMTTDLRSTVTRAAIELGVSAHAAKKWWQRGGVPAKWRKPLLDRLQAEGFAIDWDDLAAPTRSSQGQNVPSVAA